MRAILIVFAMLVSSGCASLAPPPRDECATTAVANGIMNRLNAKIGEADGPPEHISQVRNVTTFSAEGVDSNGKHSMTCIATLIFDDGKIRSGTVTASNTGTGTPMLVAWQPDPTPEEARRSAVEMQRAIACGEYRGIAWDIIALQRTGRSYAEAREAAIAKAYGPGGQVFRDSEWMAAQMAALAKAVYFGREKYGMGDATFAQSAFDECMKGRMLNAS